MKPLLLATLFKTAGMSTNMFPITNSNKVTIMTATEKIITATIRGTRRAKDIKDKHQGKHSVYAYLSCSLACRV